MNWIPDSLTVLSEQAVPLLRVLAVFGWGSLLTFGLLRQMAGDALDSVETILLAISGWMFVWVLAALAGLLLDRWLEFGPGWAVFAFALAGLLLLPGWKRHPAPFGRFSPLAAALLAAFLLSLFTRLAFLRGLLVPSYFDGAIHYQLSQNLLNHFDRFPWELTPSPVSGYYHIGFHLLTAATAFLTRIDPAQTILLLGQVILAVLPFPVFLFVRRETGSNLAAFFAFLLAGWGWNMPIHALNWGKYPALSSLLALQFALGLAFLAVRPLPRRERWSLLALAGAAAFAAVLMHTRSLVFMGLAGVSFLAAHFWQQQRTKISLLLLLVLLIELVWAGMYLESRPTLRFVFDPYLRAGLWMTLLVAALLPFALRHFLRLTVTGLLLLLFLLVILFLPVPGAEGQTLLDRPFVQMTLYLPLSLLGGLGLAGLWKQPFPAWQRWAAVAAAFTALFVSAAREHPFAASSCCILLRADDAVAFEWIETHLADDAHILIAGDVLDVLENQPEPELHAVDGGIWITPLTGRQVSLEHRWIDFADPDTVADLCARGITHVYVGSGPERFDLASLDSRPDWFELSLALPGARVYFLQSCP